MHERFELPARGTADTASARLRDLAADLRSVARDFETLGDLALAARYRRFAGRYEARARDLDRVPEVG